MISHPFLSLVVPTWNRRMSVARCLESVLSQDFDCYEVIVVDDGSTDETENYVNAIKDDRVIFVKHEENMGVCAARRTGTAMAKGKWVISIDSDFALLPGGLKLMAKRLLEAQTDTGSVLFMVYYEKIGPIPIGLDSACYVDDLSNPALSPDNVASFDIPFSLQSYMMWVDKNICSAAVICHRKEVFETVQWPLDRRLESQFHLRTYKHWKGIFYRFVVAVIFEDAPFAISSDRTESGIRRDMLSASARSISQKEILDEFGATMKICAPNFYYNNVWIAAIQYFQSGDRFYGMKFALLALWIRPSNWLVIPLIFVGMIGPKAIVFFRKWFFIRRLAAYVLSRSQAVVGRVSLRERI